MSPTLEQLRSEILALPMEDRESLLASLVDTGPPTFTNLHPAWASELSRRTLSIEDGTAEFISEAEMERELQALVAGH